jgi:4-amino-4-deoxy-L-arabinose transferase-like glycosyltransferase
MKNPGSQSYNKALFWLISLSTLLRLFLAVTLDLGNDEVYYHTYALYPDWSHFDHPPMVGWIIQLFSLGMFMDAHWLMRLPAVVFSALNTWMIFKLGKRIKDEKTAWYAALLYSSSFYLSIISGTFIMPDSPQIFFWILALNIMIDILPSKELNLNNKKKFLWLGMIIGLGMLSKYTSVFLWLGILLYLLFNNRHWFKSLYLYASGLLSILVFSPVLIWNYVHNFVSFGFHGNRVELMDRSLRFDLLGTELIGQFFYQNPVIFVLVWLAVFYSLRKTHSFLENSKHQLLLYQSIPMILVFIGVSLFRGTLPHWSGPAYVSLIVLAAAFISHKTKFSGLRLPHSLKAALGLFLLIIGLGFAEVNYGLLNLKGIVGKDITLDVYGWKQLNEKFKIIKNRAEDGGHIEAGAPIISKRWFPAAHIDYYVAYPNQTYVLGWGKLERIHKYAWINKEKGGFRKGMDLWYITLENDFMSPSFANKYFEAIYPIDTIPISRSNKTVNRAYVYIFKSLNKIPPDALSEIKVKNY